jgi:hypothetical protein
MFRYVTTYRFFILAKLGFGMAYLWYVWDFFWIHMAEWDRLSLLMTDPSDIAFSGNSQLDFFLRRAAIFLNDKAMVWVFLMLSPVAAGLYIWGRHRWLQFGLGIWMSFSMISLTSLAGVFTSTADIWVNYTFLTYSLAALISSRGEWEKSEPELSRAKWHENTSFASVYAWLVVLIQFTVYLFAGINKLVHGWEPWTTGVALQNLAFDSSMRPFIWGITVPYWLSLLLCYVTLFQRLIVPFGFYIPRFRFWSVLILGTMHLGYAVLMKVAIFPLVGIASLLMILPSFTPPKTRKSKKTEAGSRQLLLRHSLLGLFSVGLLLESARVTVFRATPWENKLMIVPAWRMFADGGASAGGKWRVILDTPQGEVDATEVSLEPLPHLWRDRFYVDTVFHDILNQNVGPDSLAAKLLWVAEKSYADHQTELHKDPIVSGSSFEIYRRVNESSGSQSAKRADLASE